MEEEEEEEEAAFSPEADGLQTCCCLELTQPERVTAGVQRKRTGVSSVVDQV